MCALHILVLLVELNACTSWTLRGHTQMPAYGIGGEMRGFNQGDLAKAENCGLSCVRKTIQTEHWMTSYPKHKEQTTDQK